MTVIHPPTLCIDHTVAGRVQLFAAAAAAAAEGARLQRCLWCVRVEGAVLAAGA